MPYCQYKIQCTNCQSETFIVCVESNPIIYKCNCCNRFVVINNDSAYTVTEKFFMKVAKESNLKYCGQVVKCLRKNLSKSYKKLIKREKITDEDISKLHEFLIKNNDSSDIIENL